MLAEENSGPCIGPSFKRGYVWEQARPTVGDVVEPSGDFRDSTKESPHSRERESFSEVAEGQLRIDVDDRPSEGVRFDPSSRLSMRSSRRGGRSSSRLPRWSGMMLGVPPPPPPQQVRFGDTRKRATTYMFVVVSNMIFDTMLRWFEAVENYWVDFRRPVVVVTGLFEVWSMGIWFGFLTEPLMARALSFIAIIDIVCNFLYLFDRVLSIGQYYLEERRRRRMVQEDLKGSQTRQKDAKDSQEGGNGSSASGARRPDGTYPTQDSSFLQGLANASQHHLSQAYIGLVLAVGMIPVQFDLYDILQTQRYIEWEVAFVLLARGFRVWWGFRNCVGLLNQQELEVYVDIKMHGTQGSSWNRTRILAKQFLIIAYFGHWFGCISYGIRRVGADVQRNLRYRPDTTRDFYQKYSETGKINFDLGQSFWESYLLAVYKGFNLNKKDMPERPIELLLEAVVVMSLLLMKAYCIGSFFKYHQKGELEVHRFRSLMSSVQQYLELYEVPPSLRKAVLNHFRFQQANHRKVQTLEVIGRLPVEVQKKLREQEVLPTVVDRNPTLFGTGLNRDFCLHIAVALAPRFLQPSEVIFMESEVPRELIFLESGAVALSRETEMAGRTEQMLRYVRADRKDDPTALGAVSLILGALHFHSARVRAGTEAVTLNLPREGYEELKSTFPEQHDQLIRNVAEAYGVEGENALIVPDENERFMASQQQEVRQTLQARQESISSTFTYAASKGDVKLVQDLLRKRVNANVADYDRRSALHLAASEGMSEVLEALLEANGDANLQDRWGSTPMQDALRNGYVGAAKMVQKHGGRLELPDPAGLLCTYASEGNTLGMQQLIDFRVDPNVGDYDARTALHLSASEGHLPVVTFLTMRKADVNAKDRWKSTPIQDAIRQGFATVASHLRSQGGRVDSDFVANQLCDAASTGDLPMLKMLFETGVDVNQGDYDARTALHLAAAEGQVLALNFLVNTAQAMHSPVDRWGSTPLQDALTGGHTICVQLLLASGAGLGPSADRAAQQTVGELATDMGFRNGGIVAFSEASGKLRRRLRAQMSLVEQRKARADIFNMEEAQRFNMQVVIASFGRMQALREEARWMIQLLQQLEPASESTWQLLRLLRDGAGLLKEAKIWNESSNIRETSRGKKKRRTSKDAPDMAFHKAFLSTTRFVPTLQTLLVATASRILSKVKQLEQSVARNEPVPSSGLSVSTVVVGELFSELGWGGLLRRKSREEHSEGFGGGAHEDRVITPNALVCRLEEMSKMLLPAEHLTWSLLSGPLKLHGSGAHAAVGGGGAHNFTKNASLDSLQQWLDQRTRTMLSGKAVQTAQHPPVLPPGARPHETFGCLWPTFYGGERRLSIRMSPLPSTAQPAQLVQVPQVPPTVVPSLAQGAADMFDHGLTEAEGVSYLVASELALLALTALVLEGWDRGAQVPAAEEQEEVGRASRGGSQRDEDEALPHTAGSRTAGMTVMPTSHSLAGAEQQAKLSVEDFQELGTAFRAAAAACRGTQQEAQKLARKIVKPDSLWEGEGIESQHEERWARESATPVTTERVSQLEGDDDGFEVEKRPIRLPKILALQDKMSLEELTILMDADDGAYDRGDRVQKSARAFGELSRERFVRNLLRCILDYDAMQNDVIAAVDEKKRESETALEQLVVSEAMTFDRNSGMAGGSVQMRPIMVTSSNQSSLPSMRQRYSRITSITELYAEADRLHEVISDTGEERRALEDREARAEEDTSPPVRRSFSQRLTMGPQVGGGLRDLLCCISPAGTVHTSRDDRSNLMKKGGSDGSIASRAGDGIEGARRPKQPVPGRLRCSMLLAGVMRWVLQYFGTEGRDRRQRQRIAKRFKELDDDGEGIGTTEVAQILAVAFKHTLGAEGELRWAYRVFELLNKADVGDLVTLPEMLSVLPKLTEEIKAQQRKNQNRREVTSSDANVGPVARFFSGFVITPESPFVHLWDQVRQIVVIYYMFEVPMRFSFLSRLHLAPWAETCHVVASAFADVFMAANIILTFFRAFPHPTLGVVSAFQEIRVHYLLSLFPVDFVACFPVDWWLPEEMNETSLISLPRAGARLLKLLHLHHLMHQPHGRLEAVWGFSREAWSMSLSVFTLGHFLACCWWLLGTRYDGYDPMKAYNDTYTFYPNGDQRGSWTYTYVHRPFETPIGDPGGRTPYWWQYLVSFHLTIGRLVSSSPSGDTTPASWAEVAFIIGLFFLNVAVSGYCDGLLVDKVIAGDEHIIEAEAMRRILDEYLTVAELPSELVHEVRSSAKLSDKMVAWKRMEDTIATLPHSLRQRVARRTVVPRLIAQEIFEHCSETFLVELGVHCRILPVGRGQVLARPGEPAIRLVILNFGRVAAVDSQGGVLAETSTPNSLVEELPFIFGLKHNSMVTVLEETQLTVLPKAGFLGACKVYPDDFMTLRRSAMKAVQQFGDDFEESSRKDDGDKSGPGKAKSTLSFGTTASKSSGKSAGTGLNEFLRRGYVRELRQVADKLREEEAAARQDIICKFIQKAADGEVGTVSSMLAKGEVFVDEGDYDNRTALHLAVCNGHLEVVKTLVEKFAAAINVKDRFSHTPIEDAVREKQVEILRYLMHRGSTQYQADSNAAAQLCQAAYENDLATLRLLLEDVGVNPNSGDYDKRTALHLGASEGHLEVVQLLANIKGIDLSPLDRLGNTPLDDAMRHKHVQVRQFLHARGAKMGERNLGVVLCSLAYADDVEGLRELADSEVSLGQGDYDARTALHLAASENRLTAATYLLIEAKVDPNPLDRFLSTPLDDAMRHKHKAMEALLRDKGGLCGSDPTMASAVEKFKEEKKVQEVHMVKRKLEKEVQSSEVSTIMASLKRFREHPTMEDDVHAFVTEAANFRDLLLRLLSWSTSPPDEAEWTALQIRQDGPQHLTKFYREQLLDRTCAKLEATLGRLVAVLDLEVLPWLASLSKAESRLLRVLVPDLRPAVTRILEQLRGGARLRKFVRHLWNEKGPGGGAYQCLPVGLLMHRPEAELAHRMRLEAEALLWATGASAGQRSHGGHNEATPRHNDEATSSNLHLGMQAL